MESVMDLDTSPTLYDAEFEIPKGLRIETERWGKRWLCSLKGSTVCMLETVGGIVWKTERLFVIPKQPYLGKRAASLAMWLVGEGYRRVEIETP
jgi:hypothetical protein